MSDKDHIKLLQKENEELKKRIREFGNTRRDELKELFEAPVL